MQTYIAFLRGINVSGVKKIKMADLRAMMNDLGFKDVETYIQSGNIIFNSDHENVQYVSEIIKKEILDVFGFDVPVLVKTKADIAGVIEKCPYKKKEDLEAKRIYYVLLKDVPKEENMASLKQENYPNELFTITKTCVYLNCIKGAGKAKLTNNIIERKLKVEATTRNHRTMSKLLTMSNEES